MNATPAKFLKVHIATVLLLFVGAFFFVTTMDPMRMFELPWSMSGPLHQNVTLQKYEMMERYNGVAVAANVGVVNGDVEAVILGSSTSENYLPADVQNILGYKTFHAAVPGSQALARMVLLKKAVQQYPDLKTAIYIADFYESNDNANLLFDHQVMRNSKLRALMPAQVIDLLPFHIKEYIWDIFSNQTVESAFKQIRIQSGRKKLDYYRENGTVAAQKDEAVTGEDATLGADGASSAEAQQISDWLRQKIDQNWLQYKSNALKNYVFSERVAKVYESFFGELANAGNKTNADANDNFGLHPKIVIVLSPLHPRFYQKLKAEPALLDGYTKWHTNMKSLEKFKNVKVYDPTAKGLTIPTTEPYWRDGVHYNQDVSAMILRALPW